MYKFLRNVSTMTGKTFRAGAIVPDGEFHALEEMESAGDIELVDATLEIENEEGEFEPVTGIEVDAPGDAPLTDEERKARNAAKARERRAAKKAGN